jgi:hypothetical protein
MRTRQVVGIEVAIWLISAIVMSRIPGLVCYGQQWCEWGSREPDLAMRGILPYMTALVAFVNVGIIFFLPVIVLTVIIMWIYGRYKRK